MRDLTTSTGSVPMGRRRHAAAAALPIALSVALSWIAPGPVMPQTRNGRFSVTVNVVTAQGGDPLPGVRVNFRNLDTGNEGYRISDEAGRCDPYYVAPGTRLSIVPVDRRYVFDDGSVVTTVNSNQQYYFKGGGVDLDRIVAATPVFRLQVVLQTSDQDDDGSDDDVWVSLGPAPAEQQPNPADRYFVDSRFDDFERRSVRAFDVPPSVWGIRTIGDIRNFTIGLRGTDAWCYARIALAVNGDIHIPVAGTRTCLDNWSGGGLRATATDERISHVVDTRHRALARGVLFPFGAPGSLSADQLTRWQDILDGRAPLVLSREEILARLESALGQRLSALDNWYSMNADQPIFQLKGIECCLEVAFHAGHRAGDAPWYLAIIPFGINAVDTPSEIRRKALYKVSQRSDRLRQTFLELVSSSGGPGSERTTLFDNQRELFRVLLFQHNHGRSEILPDGSVRFTFPRGSDRPLPPAPPRLPPGLE